MVWRHATCPVPTSKQQLVENVEIRPFCQRKGTTVSQKYAPELQKCVRRIVQSFLIFKFVSVSFHFENRQKIGKISSAYSVREMTLKNLAFGVV